MCRESAPGICTVDISEHFRPASCGMLAVLASVGASHSLDLSELQWPADGLLLLPAGVVAEGLQDLLIQYLQEKLGFDTKDQVSLQYCLQA